MGFDLGQGLHQIAEADGQGVALPGAELTARARRRRRLRGAAQVGGALALLAAVVAAGSLIEGGRFLRGEVAAPTESVTPGWDPQVWGCAAEPEAPQDASPEGAALSVSFTPSVTAGHPMTVSVGVVADSDPEVLLVRDGTVVSRGTVTTVRDSHPSEVLVELPLTSCARLGEPLPAGDYEVVARQQVTLDGAVRWLQNRGALTIQDETATVPATYFPFCGAQVPGLQEPATTPLRVAPEPLAARYPTGGTIEVTATVGGSGGYRVGGYIGVTARLVVSQNGVVVASPDDWTTELREIDLVSDGSITVPASGRLVRCGTSGGEEPLPPGDYDVYTVLDVVVERVTDTDGSDVTAGHQGRWAVSEPHRIVVTD